MEIRVHRHLWGFVGAGSEPHRSVADALPHVVPAGYDGVEAPLSFFDDREAAASAIAAAGLDLIHMAIVFGDTVEDHLRALDQELSFASGIPHRFVNCHGGRDAWTDDDAFRFYEGALLAAERRSVEIAFETHRGRPTYNPWTTDRVVARFPEIELTADLSHWVVVCERLLDDDDLLDRVARRTRHVHARVGFDEGPQVNDPRAPEHAETLAVHESWWDRIWQAQRERGLPVTTLTPEFGPPPYQPVAPTTREPLADLVEIVDWMAARQRERFGRVVGVSPAAP